MKIIYITICVCLITFIFGGCKKQDDWLDVKRSISDVRPETIKDFQALMDNYTTMNITQTLGLIGTDNIIVPDANLSAITQIERNAYLWSKDIWVSGQYYDWSTPYAAIEYANVVLDGMKKLTGKETGYNSVLGTAYFHRAVNLYNLAQIFCKPYDKNTSGQDMGIPVRLSSDVNILYPRGTLQETFNQIVKDAQQAASLLPVKQNTAYRPNQAAALALLGKVYLDMGDYDQALSYSDQAIKINGALLDFNSTSISLNATYRFPALGAGNPEILFYSEGGYQSTWPSTYFFEYIPDDLYSSYNNFDLRKTYFFDASAGAGKIAYRGAYTGNTNNYCGIALNEVYLIRAESYARKGNTNEALNDLNTLLVKRFQTGHFTPVTAASADDALIIILQERRKELPLTANIRWEDLRRLNRESRFAKTLSRTFGGKTYTLAPNSLNFTIPIPDEEIQLSGLQQNPRN